MSAQVIPFPDDAVVLKNGRAITTSQYVAMVFSKRHSDVLRTIKELDCSNDFSQRNFASATYIDAQGKPRPMYEMTKDGFTFLVMGFTGPEAARYKEDYIRAFNLMAEALLALPEAPRKMEIDEADFWKMKAELAELKLEKAERSLTPKRRNATPDEEATVITLARRGMKPSEIGRRVGRTSSGISAIIKRLRKEGRL